jgi:hypothetical protein
MGSDHQERGTTHMENRRDAKDRMSLPPDVPLDQFIHDPSPQVLSAVAADPRLTEDLALALLKRNDLPREALELMHKHKSLARLRKVQLALVMHQHTPRHVSVPAIRHLYTFDLMQIALQPGVVADVKRAAEEVLIAKLPTISSGERLALAKRSSGRVAAALLLDKEEPIMQAALANPQMTEAWIVRAVKAETGTGLLAPAVCRHPKWSYRNDVRAALLGNRFAPQARLQQFATELPLNAVKDVLRNVRLTPSAKKVLQEALEKRKVQV